MCLAQHTWGPCLVPARLVRRAWVSHASPFALLLVRRMWARPSPHRTVVGSRPRWDTFPRFYGFALYSHANTHLTV